MARRSALALALVGAVACRFEPTLAGDGGPGDGAAPADGRRLPGGLIAYYRMETLAQGIMSDASGRGHHGRCVTQTCPDVRAGRIGNGLAFDGTQRIEVPGQGELDDTSQFTVLAWVRFETLQNTNYKCPLNKLWATTLFNAWQLCVRDNPPPRTWFFSSKTNANPGLGFDDLTQENTFQVDAERWYHAGITWDGTRKRIWIDGDVIAEKRAPAIVSDGGPLTFGADSDNGNHVNDFVGMLDDVQIYNRALTRDEIDDLAD